jgi:hypothetical protein
MSHAKVPYELNEMEQYLAFLFHSTCMLLQALSGHARSVKITNTIVSPSSLNAEESDDNNKPQVSSRLVMSCIAWQKIYTSLGVVGAREQEIEAACWKFLSRLLRE